MAIYLDHAATTPMRASALAAMTAQLQEIGNPSSLHASGRRARKAVEEAREIVAGAFGAKPGDVILTSGGTEANNLAIKGLYWAARKKDIKRSVVIIGATEHHAVLDPAHWLAEHEGATVIELDVNAHGIASVEHLESLLSTHADAVAVVSVMWANNEIGSIQPIRDIAALCAKYQVPFHSDAVQAIAWCDVAFDIEGLSALTISGHKIGGPVGTGALLLKANTTPIPVQHGGGQERDVRSGTIDAAGAVGMATALKETLSERAELVATVSQLRDALIAGVQKCIPTAVLNGHPQDRLAANAHFSFPGCEGDALLMLLDAAGIECSTGSACTAGIPQPSHVLLAMGVNPLLARSSLRFSLGRTTTRNDIEALLAALPEAHARAQRAGLVGIRS